MITNPITGTPAAQTAQTSTASSQPQPDVAGALTNTDTFLQLLVAQLENQDPMNPADGTTFVTQLATFSGVEQSTQMRDDLDAIKAALTAAPPVTAPVAAPVTTTPPDSTTPATGATGSTTTNS